MKKTLSLLLVSFALTTQAQIASTFNTDADGWNFLNASNVSLPGTFQSANGNPGGYISATYASNQNGGYQQWFAPVKFKGSQLARSLGMNLSFDLQQSQAGTAASGTGDVRIENGSNVIIFTLPIKPAVAPAWSSYTIKLDETSAWQWSNPGGALASRQQIISILTNITSLEIRGTYSSNASYTSGIDNVILEQRTLQTAPQITSFSQTSGAPGTTITINGTDFAPAPANNVVYFESVAATINSASATQLSVVVPVGATYGPITIINKTTGLVTRSTKPFNPTFAKGGRIIPASFAPKINIALDATAGNDISGLSCFDMDGDGWNDIIVAEKALNDISIFRNLAQGGSISASSFAAKFSVDGAGNSSGTQMVDLDGDGKLDIVASYTSSSNYFATFRNISTPGNLAFEAAEFWYGLTYSGFTSRVIDLDGDGRADLIGQHGSSSVFIDLWIAQNISTPGNIDFGTSVDFTFGNSIDAGAGVGAGDLDNDGKPELFVSDNFGARFHILKNNSTPGTISFSQVGVINTGQYNASLQAADFNLDGMNDLIWKKSGGAIYIRLNTNTGGALDITDFTTEVILTGDVGAYGGMSISDINGDGKPDIVSSDDADVGVYENIYSGGVFDVNAFVPAYQYAGRGASATTGFASDLNGDTKPDLIFGATSTSIAIFENRNIHAPVISVNTVSPLKGAVGSAVTITGNNFSTVPSENIIWFGTVKANVLTATENLLTVEVPAGAINAHVSVTKDGLTSRYRLPFQTTFGPGVTFDNTHFAPPVSFTLTGADYDLDIGDLNRDGKPDIIAEQTNAFTYAFRNAHTTGPISGSSLIADDTLASSFNSRIEDFDGDGYFDVVSVNGMTHKNKSTLTEISFLPAISLALGASLADFADFNNDGKTDITVTADLSGTSDLLIRENRTIPGNFVAGTYGSFSQNIAFAKPSAFGGVATGDFDGDGFADVVTTNPTTDNISIYRNLGVLKISSSQFATRVDVAVGDDPYFIYKGDFDSDGKLDLMLCHWTGTSTTLLIVLQNTSTVGNISFSRIDLTNPSTATIAHIADLDGDGKPEILTTSEAGNRISIFKNIHSSGALTAASFAAPFNITVTAPRGISTADINLDGKPEIIITRAAGLLLVYENLISSIPLPTITSFTPTSGAAGTTVTVTGTNFDTTPGNNTLMFNGTAAVVTASTATSITTTVPAGATTGLITVTVAGNTATSTQFFCVPSSPPSTIGLIAYYPFTGNANDLSGNTNNGTVNGATLTTDRFGTANSAYLFNGTSSYISIPNSSSLQSPTTKLTMNAWINMAGYSLVGQAFGPIFTKSNSTSTNFMYAFAIGTAGDVEAEINNFSNFASAPYTFCFNQWYMVTAVLDNTTAYLYVNGSLIGTQTFTTNIASDVLGLEIGRDSPGLMEIFNGKIDDIRIYNRALSDCEVAGLYTPASPPPVIISFSPSSGPVTAPVTISGTGFDPIPANNTVMFNGTTAIVTASTATSITTTVPVGATTGKISVTVSCLTSLSATDFTVTATPVITINPQPASTAVCDGATASFTLTASGTTNLTYQWQKFDGTIFNNLSNAGGYTGTTTPTLTINTTGSVGAGDYQCAVSGDFAASIFSQTVSLTFTTSTTLAEITVNGTTLTASPGDTYQWYQNGDAVANATGQSFEYNIFENGVYQVDVTDNGCTSTSTPFEYLITNIENFSDELKIYPNPVKENIFIESKPPYTLYIISTTGSVVRKINSNTRETSLDLSELANGLYILRLENNKTIRYQRIVKK
ncbi:MAG: FG-GAP-like repeat-containing protein [Chryseolinea sp.]